MRSRFYFIILVMALVNGSQAQARQERVPGSRYTSARIAGMGDSGLVMADDLMSGLFYNPAALPKMQGFVADPLNISLYLNHNYITAFGLDFYNVVSLPAFAKSTFQGLGGAYAPALGGKFLFGGILLSSELGGMRNADGTFRYRTTYQLVPAIGTGIKIADGVLRLGYSLQWVNLVDGNVSSGAAGSDYNSAIAQGSGFSQTLAASLTLPVRFLPQAHLVLRNFLGTTFIPFSLLPLAKNTSGLPGNQPMTMDLAIGAQPKFGWGSGFNFSVQWRDVLNASSTPFLGLLSLGVELEIRNFLFLRGGLSSGYPSAGFGIKTKNSEFNAAWYSEEIGSAYLQQQDMRYLIQYTLRLGAGHKTKGND